MAAAVSAPLLIATPRSMVVTVSVAVPETEQHAFGAAYAMAKTADDRLALAAAIQFGEHGVASVAVHPDWVRTEGVLQFADQVDLSASQSPKRAQVVPPVTRIGFADGQHRAHLRTQHAEEGLLRRQLRPSALPVVQRRLGPQQHRDALHRGTGNHPQAVGVAVSMAPHGVDPPVRQPVEDPVIQRPAEPRLLPRIPPPGQKGGAIPFQQRYVPLHLDPEAFVHVAADRVVARKEDLQVNIRLLRNPPQQRCLVLDGVADEVGQAQWSSPCKHAYLSLKCCGSGTFGAQIATSEAPVASADPDPTSASHVPLLHTLCYTHIRDRSFIVS